MKITKNQLIISIVSILISVTSLVFCILDFTGALKLWLTAWHPILTFLLFMFIGFGVLTIVLGAVRKSPWLYFLSSILFGLSIFGILFHYLPWWICLIALVVLWIIIGLLSFVSAGNKTESIALNNSEDYKNYKERRAEKFQAEESKEKEELPEIKSFK